jgi:hypothetical protein
MTAVPPADRIAAATTSSEQATATGPTPAAIARRQTWTIIGASRDRGHGLAGEAGRGHPGRYQDNRRHLGLMAD